MVGVLSRGDMSSEGVGVGQTLVLDKITFSEEKNRLICSVSMEFPPSTVYLGDEFSMSNAVSGVGFRFSDGTEAISIVNRFNESGSISNPKFFALRGRTPLEVNTVSSDTLSDPLEVQYETAGDNLTYDFDIVPLSEGTLRAEYFIGTDDTGRKVFDYSIDVTADMVGVITRFGGNFYLIQGGTPLFVRFSGVNLAGDASSGMPYFISHIQPYVEVTVGTHIEYVTSNVDSLYIGCDYEVDTRAGQVTLTADTLFRDSFTVSDSGSTFSVSNPCVVDFSAFGQGLAVLRTPNDTYKFYWSGSEWRYKDLSNGNGGVV